MTGILFAGWFMLMAVIFIVTVWIRASEKCLLDLLATDEPPIFEELGRPTLNQPWPFARLNNDERTVIRSRSISARVQVSLRDYETALRAKRITNVVVIVAGVILAASAVW